MFGGLEGEGEGEGRGRDIHFSVLLNSINEKVAFSLSFICFIGRAKF